MKIVCSILALLAPLGATTLLKMSMDDMTTQSTAIVRAKITGSRAAASGQDIYTYYQIQVSETLKQGAILPAEIAVPGGVYGNRRQIGIGSPVLTQGQEYVLFLWTNSHGVSQLIGLSQGMLMLNQDTVSRPAASDQMVDKSGKPAEDAAVNMKWTDLRAQILSSLKKAAVKK